MDKIRHKAQFEAISKRKYW